MKRRLLSALLTAGIAAVAAVLVLQVLRAGGLPNPLAHGDFGARVLDIAVLVFREGLECILVLAAVTANMVGARKTYQRPVAVGGAVALGATFVTWFIAIRIIASLAENVSALHLQAATGLLAIIVLLLVMNWFFHKVYWTGWISMHSRRKQQLIKETSASRLWLGLALLGFSSVYREGFEIVLFLQSYRLKLGTGPVLTGVGIGAALTVIVGALTFVAHRRLPYRRMLVLTGVMLGLVMLVMVGEQAQEMQLANWLPMTPIASLSRWIPDWMGLWFAVFPTAETLAAQVLAAALVVGSYYVAREQASATPAAG
ncbi:MAG TPA: FTR1 family protein [Vicinamibacterales bacterium]|nr:FTR1 family protein [Vicinamibacterales bacterium]